MHPATRYITNERNKPSWRVVVEHFLDVLFETHVRQTSVFRFVDHDAFARLVDIVVHTEIGGASMDQHTMIARHGRKFVMGLTEIVKYMDFSMVHQL